jgi:hypothetical protein
MNNATNCFFERISALTIGVILMIGAIGLTIISITIIPVVGLILAVPLFGFSVYFFRVHFNRQCQIQTE